VNALANEAALFVAPNRRGVEVEDDQLVWFMTMSQGYTHSWFNCPVTIIQGKNVRSFGSTPRYLRYDTYDGAFAATNHYKPHGGEPMNKLLVSICHAMGLTDVTTFGTSQFGSGPLPRLLS